MTAGLFPLKTKFSSRQFLPGDWRFQRSARWSQVRSGDNNDDDDDDNNNNTNRNIPIPSLTFQNSTILWFKGSNRGTCVSSSASLTKIYSRKAQFLVFTVLSEVAGQDFPFETQRQTGITTNQLKKSSLPVAGKGKKNVQDEKARNTRCNAES